MTEYNPVNTTPYNIKYKIKSRLWDFVNATIFRCTPFFMRRTRLFIIRMFGAKVDWSCGISRSARIVDPWNLIMGKRSSIGDNCCVRCRDKVIIGEYCCISQEVDILTASHNVNSSRFEMVSKPIVIEDKSWIATRATISKGVRIGEGSVVAACSNVVKDTVPWTIVGGNPATFIKRRILEE